MSNPDFKSYTPVVGRMKSKRWVQASNPSYDGDDWGDDDYYDDDYGDESEKEEKPPMPDIPQQYANDVGKPLELGTSGEKKKQTEAEVEAEAETVPENEKEKPQMEEDAVSVDSVGESLNHEKETSQEHAQTSEVHGEQKEHEHEHEHEHEPAQEQAKVQEPEPEPEHKETEQVAPQIPQVQVHEPDGQSHFEEPVAYPDTPPSDEENAIPEDVPELPENIPELPPSVDVDDDEHNVPSTPEAQKTERFATPDLAAHELKHREDQEDRENREQLALSGEEQGEQSDIDEIFEYYASEHETTPKLNGAKEVYVAPVEPLETVHRTNSRDSNASLSTGRDDSDAEPEQEQEQPKEKPPIRGRWKPLPAQEPEQEQQTQEQEEPPLSATSYNSQDRLEREILGSFGDDANNNLKPQTSAGALSASSEDADPDPEMVELYQNTTTFLHSDNRQSSTEPLTTSKTHSTVDEMEKSVETIHHRDQDYEVISDSEPEPEDEHEVRAAHEPHEPHSEQPHIDSDQLPETTRESTDSAASVETDKSEALPTLPPVQSQPAPQQAFAPPPQRLQQRQMARPPKFDFMGILTKGNPLDRKKAFDEARQRELEYDVGLSAWLNDASSEFHGAGVYSSGKPPPPTQNEKQLAMPSRTMSSTFIRPAKHIANSNVVDKVGEKTTKKAKSLFARGKKLIS